MILGACSKAKQFEKRLIKKEGTWNISKWEFQRSYDGVAANPTVHKNVGIIVFKKGGFGSWQYEIAGLDTIDDDFAWSNTEATVTITDSHGENLYHVLVNEKNDQLWFSTSTDTLIFPIGGGQPNDTTILKDKITLTLERIN